MSDDAPKTEPKPTTGGPEQTDAAARKPEPPYRIHAQYIKDLSVENPQAPEIFTDPMIRQVRPQVQIDVTTRPLGNRLVEVVVQADVKGRIEPDAPSERTAFLIELAYGCAVEIGAVEKEAIEPLLMVEIPRLLFPYVRAVLSEMSRDAGHNILLMPPVDFVGIYRWKKQQGELDDGTAANVAAQTADGTGRPPATSSVPAGG